MSGDVHVQFCERPGVRFPRATHLLVMCDTKASVEAARERVALVDLTDGRGGFDVLGCHLHKRMSGPIWARSALTRVLPAPMAVSARDEAGARPRAGADSSRALPHGPVSRHRGREPGPFAGVGTVFPDGKCVEPLRAARQVRGTALTRLAPQAGGSRLAAGRAQAWQRPFFEASGLVRPARHDSVSGGGACYDLKSTW